MSSTSRTKAKKDQFVCNFKENAGSVVGNESFQTKGRAQNNADTA